MSEYSYFNTPCFMPSVNEINEKNSDMLIHILMSYFAISEKDAKQIFEIIENKKKNKEESVSKTKCSGYKFFGKSPKCFDSKHEDKESCLNCMLYYTKECDQCNNRIPRKHNLCIQCHPKCISCNRLAQEIKIDDKSYTFRNVCNKCNYIELKQYTT